MKGKDIKQYGSVTGRFRHDIPNMEEKPRNVMEYAEELLHKLSDYYLEGFPNNKQCVKDLLGEIDDYFKMKEEQRYAD